MMSARNAAALRRVAVAAEEEWARQGWPAVGDYPLGVGCCALADEKFGWNVGDVVAGCARPEFAGSDVFLAPRATEWSARILWLYVIAHAVEEGRA